MPIYEYRCAACGRTFENLQTRSDETPERCPTCGATELARQLSVFAVNSSRSAAPAGPCGSDDCACRRT